MAWGALDWIAERRIEQAVAAGELSHLPGEGRLLPDDIDPLVPEDMRNVVRVLRRAGGLPVGFEHLREVRALEAQVARAEGTERRQLLLKLAIVRTRLERDGLGSVARDGLGSVERDGLGSMARDGLGALARRRG